MDDLRFDNLARAVAGQGSRRSILRGLAGLATFLAWGRQAPEASAQFGSLGPGEPCYDDGQCAPSVMDYSPLVCADNGFDYDGPLNCCTGVGGFCFSDEGCCGAAYCGSDQRCWLPPSYPVSDLRNPGDPCQSTDQCNRPVTGAICEYTSSTGDNRCCWYEGSLCSSGAQCCGSRICSNGVCMLTGGQRPVLPCTGPGCACDPNGASFCDDGLFCCASQSGYVCASGQQCGFVTCGDVGCTCVGGAMDTCGGGLICCVQGDAGAIGVCLSVDTCYATGPGCTSEGCTCAVQNPFACSGDLICCGPGGPNALGTCQYISNC